jgi:predicted AlkP superfamily phosphohydrolase/phosphomutase
VEKPGLTIVGLDAATFDVVDPLVEAGDLPNLAGLLVRGARGVLHSTTHPLTPLAWSTMVTGVNAGRHGIWDFSERDESGYRLRLVNGSHRRAPALWSRLSAAGRRVAIVNVPFTWPAPQVNGFAIAGLDASEREDGMTYPRDLLPRLRARFGEPALDHSFPLDAHGRLDLELVRRACRQRVEVVERLLAEEPVDFLFVVFMSADHIHHVAWPDWEARGRESSVAEVYRILDEALGRLLALGGGGNALVVSDHGGGSLHGVVNLNAWLADCGYLAYAGSLGALDGGRLGHELFRLRERLPRGLRYAAKQRLPRLREWAYRHRSYSVVDWSRTRAFSYGIFGNVVLNVRGRERDGIVEPGEEYERLRDEIAARALRLESPDGEPIVAAVHRREDLFDGPELAKIPDLVVEFRDYAWLGKGNLTGRTETIWDEIAIGAGSTAYSGSHRPEGILVLAGPAARAGAEVVAGIEDVAPTALYLLDEPIPSELEGRVLVDALDPELLAERPPRYADDGPGVAVGVEAVRTYGDAGGAEVEERLRSLGYLE